MCSLVTLLFLALPSAVLLKLIVLLSSGKTPSFSKCFATVLVADFLALLFWCMLWFLGLSGPWIATVVVVLTSTGISTLDIRPLISRAQSRKTQKPFGSVSGSNSARTPATEFATPKPNFSHMPSNGCGKGMIPNLETDHGTS